MGGLSGRIGHGHVGEIILRDGMYCPCVCTGVSNRLLHTLTLVVLIKIEHRRQAVKGRGEAQRMRKMLNEINRNGPGGSQIPMVKAKSPMPVIMLGMR